MVPYHINKVIKKKDLGTFGQDITGSLCSQNQPYPSKSKLKCKFKAKSYWKNFLIYYRMLF